MMSTASEERERGSSWPTPLVVNLLLGIPAVVPIWLTYYWAANWPLAGLGLPARNPTENDGVLPWVLLAGPILLGFGLTWWLINWSIGHGSILASVRYWLLCVAATAAPTFALFFTGWVMN